MHKFKWLTKYLVAFCICFSSSIFSHAELVQHRSLAVTEVDILTEFKMQDVINQLIRLNNSSDVQSAQDFWDQWNGTNAICTDINGFPVKCRDSEVTLDATPFEAPFIYQATGLFNRFDLAASDGSDCGEYRIIFARKHSDFQQAKTIIFEARLANPDPAEGLKGCLPVTRFWADLSSINDNQLRAAKLKDFYFNGLPGFSAVFHPDNFQRKPGSGQIRSNSFVDNGEWSMREYGLANICSDQCRLSVVQHAIKENPFIPLVASNEANAFQDWLVDFISTPGQGLLADSIPALSMPVPDIFNAAEALLPESRGRPLPIDNLVAEASTPFLNRIQTKLDSLDTAVTAEAIIKRANSLTCHGCHRTSTPQFSEPNTELGFATPFPAVDNFRHVSLSINNSGPNGPRHRMSDALTTMFLPARTQHMADYLAEHQRITASLLISSKWQGGYCANVKVNNSSQQPSAWQLSVDLKDANLVSSWEASITPQAPGFVAKGLESNALLAPGTNIQFGFCASYSGNYMEPSLSVITSTL